MHKGNKFNIIQVIFWAVIPVFWRTLLPPSSDEESARASKTLVSYCNTTQHHNPEDFYLNLHYENLKSCEV
jgi:P pilus assembly chaperone PapD